MARRSRPERAARPPSRVPPMTDHHGLGDRWLAGEQVDGVAFGLRARVEIVRGRHARRRGTVLLLMDVGDDPLYLVDLGGLTIRVRQSDLKGVGS